MIKKINQSNVELPRLSSGRMMVIPLHDHALILWDFKISSKQNMIFDGLWTIGMTMLQYYETWKFLQYKTWYLVGLWTVSCNIRGVTRRETPVQIRVIDSGSCLSRSYGFLSAFMYRVSPIQNNNIIYHIFYNNLFHSIIEVTLKPRVQRSLQLVLSWLMASEPSWSIWVINRYWDQFVHYFARKWKGEGLICWHAKKKKRFMSIISKDICWKYHPTLIFYPHACMSKIMSCTKILISTSL